MNWKHLAVTLSWRQVAVATLMLWALLAICPPLLFWSSWETAGVLGDSMGVVNSFFNSLGFIILATALLTQIKESRDNTLTQERQMVMLEQQTKLQEAALVQSGKQHDLAVKQHDLEVKQAELLSQQTDLIARQVEIKQSEVNESMRRLTLEALVKVYRDMQKYRDVCVASHTGGPDSLLVVEEQMLTIREDFISIALLFGPRSDDAQEAIVHLSDVATSSLKGPADKAHEVITAAIKKVFVELLLLWQSLPGSENRGEAQ